MEKYEQQKKEERESQQKETRRLLSQEPRIKRMRVTQTMH